MDPNQPSESPAPAPVVAPTPSVAPLTPSSVNPGKTLGIVSLVLSIIGVGLVGLILGIIGLNKSKQAGQGNGLAIAGIIVGILNMIVVTFVIIIFAMAAGQLASKCAELGNGTHVVDGITYSCGVSQ